MITLNDLLNSSQLKPRTVYIESLGADVTLVTLSAQKVNHLSALLSEVDDNDNEAGSYVMAGNVLEMMGETERSDEKIQALLANMSVTQIAEIHKKGFESGALSEDSEKEIEKNS